MMTWMTEAMPVRALVLSAALAGPALGCQSGGVAGSEPPEVVVPPAPPAREFANADELLKELETADADLRTLQAEIVYDKSFALAGDKQTRKGQLYFQGYSEAEKDTPTKGRKFAIHFDILIVGNRVMDEPEIYIFDGQWLLEKHPKEKRFTKRAIVPPGEKFDPLKIGEGPLPIPIGQKREDIVSRYDATLLSATDGLDAKEDKDLIPFVAGSHQLRLVPKAGRKDQDKFGEIRLWYRSDDGGRMLPRMAKTAAASEPGQEGDQSVVRLINVVVNADMPKDVIDTAAPAGWDGQVLEFREAK